MEFFNRLIIEVNKINATLRFEADWALASMFKK
jgi:hypothetical protein